MALGEMHHIPREGSRHPLPQRPGQLLQTLPGAADEEERRKAPPSSASSSWEQLKAGKRAGSMARSRNKLLPLIGALTSLASSWKHTVYFCKTIILQIRLESLSCMWVLEKEQSRNVLEGRRTELDHPDT